MNGYYHHIRTKESAPSYSSWSSVNGGRYAKLSPNADGIQSSEDRNEHVRTCTRSLNVLPLKISQLDIYITKQVRVLPGYSNCSYCIRYPLSLSYIG